MFVERQTYRRRRLVDAARALPVLGLLLWLLPLLWSVPEDGPSASTAMIYIFSIWIGLPLVSGALVFAMKRLRDPAAEDPASTGAGEPQ
jgi:hypothetical protein